jgi:glyoxylase-like metal-dependent hydrolase (beta-lactamase superfamily II)
VLVLDAPHDADAIAQAVGDRTVVAIACTHAHDDHVRMAPELGERLSAPVLLHPDDRVLWDLVHARPRAGRQPARRPGARGRGHPRRGAAHAGTRARRGLLLGAGPRGGVQRRHAVLGRARRHGRSHSDYPTILDSIRRRLFALPPETRVLTGHGDETTVAGGGAVVRRVGEAGELDPGVLDEGVEDRRPQARGQVVAHAGQDEQARAGDRLGGRVCRRDADERVVLAVDDQASAPAATRSRSLRSPEAWMAMSCRAMPPGVVGPVVRLARDLAQPGLVELVAGEPVTR